MAKKTQRLGNGHHKDFEYNLETEHGQRLAKEAQEKVDAKDAFKKEYKTHTMEISRDDIDRLLSAIKKVPTVGYWKRIVEFLTGDKGYWTEELTLKIVEHDTHYSDYINPHESRREKIAELEAQLKVLKQEDV